MESARRLKWRDERPENSGTRARASCSRFANASDSLATIRLDGSAYSGGRDDVEAAGDVTGSR
jgi:hypothetical protein